MDRQPCWRPGDGPPRIRPGDRSRRTLRSASRFGEATSHARLPPAPPRLGLSERPSVPMRLAADGTANRGRQARQATPPAAATEARARRGAQRRHHHGRRHHAPAARQRRPLRAPDPSLEPQDEALHLHRAQRHLHHRPAAVADLHRPRLRVRQGDRRPRRHRPVRRHQEAGAGVHRRAGHPRRHAVRQPALARRHAHQLLHRAQAPAAHEGARGHRLRRRRRLRHDQEGTAGPEPREGQARARPSAVSAT